MVLTDERDTSFYPAATLEASTLANEQLYYHVPDDAGTRVDKSTVPGYPNDTYTSPNDFIHRLNGNGTKVGSSIVLKVMSGDRFTIHAKSWYRLNGVSPDNPVDPISELIASLAGGVTRSVSGKYTSADLIGSGILSPGVTSMLNSQVYTTTKPKAFVNWVLFDEQFKFVGSSSGIDQVGADQEFKTHILGDLPVTKSGYLYIYVSNETPNVDVFFDNLQVTHIHGPLLEETHYYPFGLTMAGISSKAAGKLENKNDKFQGQPLDDDLGLNWYGFKWRNHDPQIGRFIEVDPLSDKYVHNSTYAFSENKVVAHVELEGLESVEASTVMYSQNGKSRILHSSTNKVDNPHNLGRGKLNHLTLIEMTKDGMNIRTTELYEPTLGQRVVNFFKGVGQIQIYGSGHGGDDIGSKPDYSKPIASIDLGEIGPLLDIIANGGSAKPELSRPSPDKPDFAKLLMDAVLDASNGQSGAGDGGKGGGGSSSSSAQQKPPSVKRYYDGSSASNEKGSGQGLRTSSDPVKPDTILYEKKKKQ